MPHSSRHSLSSRYLQARVNKVFPDGGLEAAPLPPANTAASRIRVHHYHLPAERWPANTPYQPGDTLSLFIYDDRRSQNDPAKAAYASAIWATPADNPWESENALSVGQTVTGSVIGFPDDRHAIVLLDGLLAHAWLNAKEVPDARPYYCHDDQAPLAKFLSLNDRIKARLQAVDREHCRLEISILAAFSDWESACRQAAQDEATPPPGYERLRLPELAEHEEQIFLWQPTEGQLARTSLPESAPQPARSVDSDAVPGGPPIWQNVRLLIIENDSAFAQSLQAWLRSQGAAVWLCAGHNDLQRLHKNGPIDSLSLTHVLCDFNLSSYNEAKTCHAWVERHLGRPSTLGGTHVAWMSALPEEVLQARQAGTGGERLSRYLAGLPLFVKPIFFGELHAWLTAGRPPPQDGPADSRQQKAWHADLPDAPVLERARAALARFCTAGKALAALWIDIPSDDLSENDYDDVQLDLHVRASHGVVQQAGDWRLELGQSLLRDVFVSRSFRDQRVATAGPLRKGAPQAAEWVAAWPIIALGAPSVDGPSPEPSRSPLPDTPPQGMLLAYFGREDFSSASCQPGGRLGELAALTCRHLDDLGALFSLSRFAREQDLFASAGRQLAAVLHELRSLSGDLVPLVTGASPEQGAVAMPATLSRNTRHALGKLLKVAKQGLFYVRKERPEQLGLAGMLQRMTADLLWLPIHRSGCSLHVRLPPKAMQVNIPLEPLEHALGNIIGNAVDWSQGRTYARVVVSVDLRPELGSMPLCIRVSDQGLGVGRDAQRNLFTPRLTEKGRKGQGMGVYISRTLLRSIGGDLLFDPHDNFRFFGATFEIRLPWCLG